MHQQHLNTFKENCSNETKLYLATRSNDEATVKAILASPRAKRAQLNRIESTSGWTPLFIACINGLASIASILLVAGAHQDVVDFAGWTAQEHAVFRGHLGLAKLFAPQDKVPTARLRPQHRCSINYRSRSSICQIFIYLGSSHTRSNLTAVEIYPNYLSDSRKACEPTVLCAIVRPQGTCIKTPYNIPIPIPANMVNTPVSFSTEDPTKVILAFEIYGRLPAQHENIQVLGTATAILKSLREGYAPKRESITRHHTIPIIQNKTMDCIGTITFSVLIVNPFSAEQPLPKASTGFWGKNGSYSIVGHRGSGANSTAHTALQIGENTYQSFLTAVDRGASCVEFDVQLTKDYCPVIYHDFAVKETGGDISLHGLSFDQFQHLSRSQAPNSDRFSPAERRYIETAHSDSDCRLKPRRHSLNEYDHSRSQDLLERIKYTDEGLRGNFKGNLRGCAIQEPSTTLEQLLVSLPGSIAFDLEIKYPMLWEAEDRAMDFTAIELNVYVDTILSTLFRYCGNRNITLSSFSPEICIALACKQRTFPILMISKAGTVPAGDIRAGSLKGAIDFATAWNLNGIVVASHPLVMCPRLVAYAKDMGLVVASYGPFNNEPDCVLIQTKAGLDAIITDKAHLISKSFAHMRR